MLLMLCCPKQEHKWAVHPGNTAGCAVLQLLLLQLLRRPLEQASVLGNRDGIGYSADLIQDAWYIFHFY